MRVLELKVPPPVVALVTAVLMWLASHSSPTLALFVVYIKRFQIVPEERALTSLFAREFVDSRVRRSL